MNPLLGLSLLLQQGAFLGATSPATGDTVGYWQQRADYTIVGILDEERQTVRASATLIYTNNSPDTLHEMFVHQHLNAFRPHSKWSDSDEREGRVRFQNLAEPDFGYERFHSAPTVDGTSVLVTYPGSPDSTVARFALPRPLPPGGTVHVQFAWEARPSTVPRRQGRRGRTFDFAQWYPKVAVYDRAGWRPNALVPAGEFYGEFGDFDVTLVVRDDQVLGATGVPVSGDPGWARVSRTGPPRLAANAYPGLVAGPPADVPPGMRAVRFHAKDVHHFAWTASPDYIYEGGIYVRPTPVQRHFTTWDSVSIHVLMKPGDDTTWGRGLAVRRTIDALAWLEGIFGPYAYPQVTNTHRLDGGGTEFPMMMMNSSASYGLILHELGHIYAYGILANNEWRSGWMDEGLADYQTYWAQGLTPQERVILARAEPPGLLAPGYRVNAITIPQRDSVNIPQIRLELLGRSEPPGTNSADFSEFTIYNLMIYDRARGMFGHLRDLMGDSVFVAFLRDYYGRWALKHVDERAMRASASRAYGKDLGWFFDQWIHRTGLLDYGINSATTTVTADGRYVTSVDVEKHGSYAHAMPVGIHTSRGWSIARAFPELDRQILQITTAEPPDSIILDPFRFTWDWDRRNDVPGTIVPILRNPRAGFDWPFLRQSDRSHTLFLFSPAIWTSVPQGAMIGARVRTNHIGMVDRYDAGIALSARHPPAVPGGSVGFGNRFHVWVRTSDPYLPLIPRPLMGYRAGLAHLDGITKIDASKEWDLSPFMFAPGPTIRVRAGVDGAYPWQSPLLPEQWTNTRVTEGWGSIAYRPLPFASGLRTNVRLDAGWGYAAPRHRGGNRGYARVLGTIVSELPIVPGTRSVTARVVGGWSPRAPRQRSIFASSVDPLETFHNNYYRPRGALLKRMSLHYRQPGGGGLRGYSPYLALDRILAANVEGSERVHEWTGPFGRLDLFATAFADAGVLRVSPESPLGRTERVLADAGVGALVRGRFYDRDVAIRLDFPLLLSTPALGHGRSVGGGSIALRWTFAVE